MRLRPARPADEALLLRWANDPDARAASLSPAPIQPDVHHEWLARFLAHPQAGRIWIGVDGGHAIGVVRFELVADRLVVSIALDPAERGRGSSRALLEGGLQNARKAFPGVRFSASVRPGNDASLALFRGAGFEPPDDGAGMGASATESIVVLERD